MVTDFDPPRAPPAPTPSTRGTSLVLESQRKKKRRDRDTTRQSLVIDPSIRTDTGTGLRVGTEADRE